MIIHKSVEYVKFLNKNIVKMNKMVGSTLYSNTCGKFTVLERCKKENNHYFFKIIFNKTKSVYIVRGDLLINGTVKDYMSKTMYNIACLGKEYLTIRKNDPTLCRSMLKRYKSMIERCYCKNNHNYKFYGAIGITVSDDWLNFSNYYNDIIHIVNFDRDKFLAKELVIDKDVKQSNIEHSKRVYSKYTVSLISEHENLKYRNLSNCGKITAENNSKYFSVTDGIY